MDMAFFHRAERMLAHDQPVRIDHSILVATLAAQRQASAGAGAEAIEFRATVHAIEEPLVELLLAGPCWREAIAVQRGCFSRTEAGRRRNVP